MASFFSQILEPGGGVILLPFVRLIIALLLLLTLTAAVVGVARVHMIILSFLSAGLLVSLSFFESEYNKARGYQQARQQQREDDEAVPKKAAAPATAAKTD